MKLFALPLLALMLTLGAYAQPAVVFAPGVISSPAHEGPFVFTPDGQTVYFMRFAAGMTSPGLFASHLRNGKWDEPKQIALPEGATPAPFALSPDGAKLYYTHSPDSRNRSRLWVADRGGDEWKNARQLGGVFGDWDGDQASPSVVTDGTLYFASNRQGGSGGWDIYRSILKYGEYQEPELIGKRRHGRISTLQPETSVTAAPDGRFLVFSSTGSPNGLGGSDLYFVDLSIPQGSSAWAWNLGPLVNTAADETDARLSADGERLFFSRSGDIYEVDLESVRRPPAESAAWKQRATLPISRNWPQAVAANGRIYLYGGFTGGLATGRPQTWVHQIDVFDPGANSWSTLPPPPDDWKQATLASMDNRLFLFRRGGPGVAEYNAASNRWETRTPPSRFEIPEAWPFKTRTVVLGRKAYTMFDSGDLRSFSYFVEYDFDTGAWTPRRSMPFIAPQLAAFGGRIYAFSGGEYPESTHVSVYDPVTDQWTEAARMDMPRWEGAVATYKDEIWLIGGHGLRSAEPMDGDICPTVMRFDPRRNVWSSGPALPWQRAAAAAVTVSGRMFVVGGLRPGTAFDYDTTLMEYVPGK